MSAIDNKLRAARVTARLVARRWLHRIEQTENGAVSRALSADVRWAAPGNAFVAAGHRLADLPIRMSFGIASAERTRIGVHIGSLSFSPGYRDESAGRSFPPAAFMHVDLDAALHEELWVRTYGSTEATISCVIEGFQTTSWSEPRNGDYLWPGQQDGRRRGLSVVSVSLMLGGTAQRDGDKERARPAPAFPCSVALEAAFRKQIEDRYPPSSQGRSIALDLMAAAIAAARSAGEDEAGLTRRLDDPKALLEDLAVALGQEQPTDEGRGRLWVHVASAPPSPGSATVPSPKVDRAAVADVARRYCQAGAARSDLLEWIIVDALVYAEIQALAEALDARSAPSLLGSLLPGQTARARSDQRDLLAKMRNAYAALTLASPISPASVRSRLVDAERAGANWDQAVYALLDVAAQRTPPVWAFALRK
jgi:hypothetical protein